MHKSQNFRVTWIRDGLAVSSILSYRYSTHCIDTSSKLNSTRYACCRVNGTSTVSADDINKYNIKMRAVFATVQQNQEDERSLVEDIYISLLSRISCLCSSYLTLGPVAQNNKRNKYQQPHSHHHEDREYMIFKNLSIPTFQSQNLAELRSNLVLDQVNVTFCNNWKTKRLYNIKGIKDTEKFHPWLTIFIYKTIASMIMFNSDITKHRFDVLTFKDQHFLCNKSAKRYIKLSSACNGCQSSNYQCCNVTTNKGKHQFCSSRLPETEEKVS